MTEIWNVGDILEKKIVLKTKIPREYFKLTVSITEMGDNLFQEIFKTSTIDSPIIDIKTILINKLLVLKITIKKDDYQNFLNEQPIVKNGLENGWIIFQKEKEPTGA